MDHVLEEVAAGVAETAAGLLAFGREPPLWVCCRAHEAASWHPWLFADRTGTASQSGNGPADSVLPLSTASHVEIQRRITDIECKFVWDFRQDPEEVHPSRGTRRDQPP